MTCRKLIAIALFGTISAISLSLNTRAEIIFVGDARVASMQKALSGIQTQNTEAGIGVDENGTWITDDRADSQWMAGTAINELKNYLTDEKDQVILIPAAADASDINNAENYKIVLDKYKGLLDDDDELFLTDTGPTGIDTKTFDAALQKENSDCFIRTSDHTYKTDAETGMPDDASSQIWYKAIQSRLGQTRTDTETKGISINNNGTDWLDNMELTVSFNPAGGEGDITPKKVKFNEPTGSFPALKKAGYEIDHWEAPDGTTVTETTPITTDITLIAMWKPSMHTPVTIIQKTEQLDGSIKETGSYTAYGTTDDYVSITPKSIEGFTTPDAKIVFVHADGSSSEEFTYKRNSYKISLNIKEGVISKQKKFIYKYEAPVELKLENKPFYDEIVVKGPVTKTSFNMPAENLELNISAKPIKYHIRYHGFGLFTNNLKQTYTINDVPFTLETPDTSPFVRFRYWTYDKEKITQIKDMSHTDIILKGKTSPGLLFLLLPVFLAGLITAWYIFRKEHGGKKHKHEKTLF